MNSEKHSVAVYPGTFDPITNGHLDIIERALNLFDKVIVAIAVNSTKSPLFSLNERKLMIEKSLSSFDQNKIEIVDLPTGLLVDFASHKGAKAIIRGIRAVSDFDYEFQLALMNRKLERDVDTVFLMPGFRWIYISSTIIKDVAKNNGDISDLVPENVNYALKKKYSIL
ncbi:MAG: pantetheine-phosphate adenylyltransferase [Desulfotalea sp.]